MFVWYVRGAPRTYEGPPPQKISPVLRAASTNAVTPRSEGETAASSLPNTNRLRSYATSEHADEPPRRQILYVREIMSRPVKCVSPEELLEDVSHLFATKKFRHVPVCDASGKLVGIASERDMLRKMLARSSDLFAPITPVSVAEFMKTSVLTAQPEAEVRFAARIMYQEKIGALPVVDENGRVLGMVTRSDILKTVMNTVPLELWS